MCISEFPTYEQPVIDPTPCGEKGCSTPESIIALTPTPCAGENCPTPEPTDEQPVIDPTPEPTDEQPIIDPTPEPTGEQPSIDPTPCAGENCPTPEPTDEQPVIDPTPCAGESCPTPEPTDEQPVIDPTPEPTDEQPVIDPTPCAGESCPTPEPTDEQPVVDPTPEPTNEQPVIDPTPCAGENCPTPEPTNEQPVIDPTPCVGESCPTPEPTGEQPVIDPTPEPTAEQPVIDPTPEPNNEQPVIDPTPGPTDEQPVIDPTPCAGESCPAVTPEVPAATPEAPAVTPTPSLVCTTGILGKLVDAVDVGLPNWTITAQLADASEPAVQTTTDGTGTFTLNGLQAGRWMITYELQSGWAAVSATRVELVVAEGSGCTGVVFTIKQQHTDSPDTPTPVPGCLITYRHYTDGSAIRELATWEMRLRPVNGDAPNYEVTADTTGYAKFSDLPPGEWVLEEELLSGQSCITNAEVQVTIPAGPLCAEIFLGCTPPEPVAPPPLPTVVPPTGCIAGQVINDSHVGLPGWQVMAKPVDGGEPLLTVTSDGVGAFQLRDLKPGRWILWETVPAGWSGVTVTAFEVTVPADPACVAVRFKNRQD